MNYFTTSPTSYMSNNLAAVWNQVPMAGTANNQVNNAWNNQFQANQRANESENQRRSKVERLTGDDLVEARINVEEYPVEEQHIVAAESLVDAAKVILSKDGDNITAKEWATLDKIFTQVQKDPRIAEAFVTAANETEFEKINDDTSTLLGCYESALIEKYNDFGNGKDVSHAEAKINRIKESLKKNVINRNADAWSDFCAQHAEDKGYTNNSIADKFKRNRESILTGGMIAGGATAATGAGLLAFGAANFWNPLGWVALGTGALATGYAAYKMASN